MRSTGNLPIEFEEPIITVTTNQTFPVLDADGNQLFDAEGDPRYINPADVVIIEGYEDTTDPDPTKHIKSFEDMDDIILLSRHDLSPIMGIAFGWDEDAPFETTEPITFTIQFPYILADIF
jgi:hypothetical protein